MKNRDLELSSYDFNLPKELIAQKPLEKRDESKLLVYKNGKILHLKFKEILRFFKENDIIIYNNTKVNKTKLFGKKTTGGKVEVTLLEKISNSKYKVLLKMKNPKVNNIIIFSNDLFATIKKVEDFEFIIEFNRNPDRFIKEYGRVTLPPYVKNPNIKDEDYQTIFAKEPGSIAAPTAAFHFTKELVEKIKQKGVRFYPITLNVGLGTFAPVKTENIKNHNMHEESFTIYEETANAINKRSGRLFLVGTTTLRALESATDENGKVISQTTKTNLFIYPGYKFKLNFDALITNFHLPKSTLVMLVSAIIGRRNLLKAYKEAIKLKYRFFSFGDAMLILRNYDKFQEI